MTVDGRLAYVEKQIVGLEKDANVASKLANKFDLTLDKMSEATSSIQQLLAVHDNMIRRQHETDMDLYRTIDDHRRDSIDRNKDLLAEIEKSNNVVSGKIDKLDGDLSEKLIEMGTISADHDRRIRGLERLTYIGLGLCMLIAILVDKIPFDKIF